MPDIDEAIMRAIFGDWRGDAERNVARRQQPQLPTQMQAPVPRPQQPQQQLPTQMQAPPRRPMEPNMTADDLAEVSKPDIDLTAMDQMSEYIARVLMKEGGF